MSPRADVRTRGSMDWERMLRSDAERLVAAKRFEPPPGPSGPPSEMEFPAAAHVWGGNSQTAFTQCDLVVCSSFGEGNPATAKVNNPTLIAMAHMAWDPYNADFNQRHTFALTYGAGARQWTGGNDNLQPSPGNFIRGFQPGTANDDSCTSQGSLHFAFHHVSTHQFLRKLAWYCWKLRNPAHQWDGVWSDNLFPSNLLFSGNVFGSCASTTPAADWKTGFIYICDGLRGLGVPMVGGNQAYRATDTNERLAANVAMVETLESAFDSATAFQNNGINHTEGWYMAGPQPRMLFIMHLTPPTASVMRKGLALASIMKGAYMPYQSHSDLYQPAEMFPRRRWGKALGGYSRVGNTFSQQFEAGTVSHNFDTGVSSFPS